MPVPLTQLTNALAATWPPASQTQIGPVTIREGKGGGSRVSSATAPGPISAQELSAAETAMRDLGQVPQWQLPAGSNALDDQLAQAGYAIAAETVFMVMKAADLAAQDQALMSSFRAFPPLAVQREIWSEGQIGPARLAVMDRAPAPKISLLGRVEDQPAGAAFVACHDGIAMVHALEILDRFRRKGLARNMMIASARWAQDEGADWIAITTTRDNTAARALYAQLGFAEQPGYHYRTRQEAPL